MLGETHMLKRISRELTLIHLNFTIFIFRSAVWGILDNHDPVFTFILQSLDMDGKTRPRRREKIHSSTIIISIVLVYICVHGLH